jgi:hypothetical protein
MSNTDPDPPRSGPPPGTPSDAPRGSDPPGDEGFASYIRFETTLRAMRGEHVGVLRVGESTAPCRYVIDGATGHPVFPATFDADPMADDRSTHLLLCVPDDSFDCLEILGAVQEIDPRSHESCDRYQIYHGRPQGRRWVMLAVDSGKQSGRVIEGSAIAAANPLRTSEPKLCRSANASPQRVLAVCRSRFGTSNDQATVVGVDPLGFDLRTRFGVRRVEFESPATSIVRAEGMMRELLDRGS